MKKICLMLSAFFTLNAFALSACGKKEQQKENTPEVHRHVYTDTVVAPECVTSGYTLHVCECGYAYADAFNQPTGHTFNVERADERYFKGVTCGEKREYYKSCKCGVQGEETFFYGVTVGHVFDKDGCTQCGFTFSETSEFYGIDAFSDEIQSKYTFRKNSTIPVVSIETDSGEDVIAKEYLSAKISVENCAEEYVLDAVEAQVKVRGNATATYAKKPFRIKFKKKQKMLGLNDDLKAKSWVLLAEYADMTSMKQSLALYLGKGIFGEDLYCSDFMHVEVRVNGEYRGVYLLAEQQQIGNSRVDINEAEDGYEGVDVGYLFELDGYAASEDPLNRFFIDYERSLTIAGGENSRNYLGSYAIKSDIYATEQRDFLSKTVKNIFEIVYDALYRNHADIKKLPYLTLDKDGNIKEDDTITSARQAVERVLNVDSFVKTYILNQIAMDADMGWSSFFMSLDMSSGGDKRLTLQAPWDFEHAFGGRDEPFVDAVGQPFDVEWQPMTLLNPWLLLLSNESWFKKAVYDEWTSLKENGLFLSAADMALTYANTFCENYNADRLLWYGSSFEVKQVEKLVAWLKVRVNALNRIFATFAI